MTKDTLKLQIAETEAKLIVLREQLSQIEKSEDICAKLFVGKYVIQNMYEAGTRYIYVTDARRGDGLELEGYGVIWDEQGMTLEIIDPDCPEWFGRCEYGELQEVTREEFIKILKDNINHTIDYLLNV